MFIMNSCSFWRPKPAPRPKIADTPTPKQKAALATPCVHYGCLAGGRRHSLSQRPPATCPIATRDGDADVVIASRFQPGSVVQGVPFFRQVLSWGCFLMMKTLLPYRNVRDYSTGFRAYRSVTLGRLAVSSEPSRLRTLMVVSTNPK